MTIMFTEKEKDYLIIKSSGDYRLTFKPDTPEKLKKTIQHKIDDHKKWLNNGGIT